MGLDIYAGPVSRYVAGDWQTIIQQAGDASGIPVVSIRPGESIGDVLSRALAEGVQDGVREVRLSDVRPVTRPIAEWKADLIRSLGLNEDWQDAADGPFYTDKPGWDGYGAVLLLSAYDEKPSLAPGARVKRLFRPLTVPAVAPGQFADAEAVKAAAQSPLRYPTLLRGAEWCLPLAGGPALFTAATPSGKQITMGHLACLVAELDVLNQRTLRLSPDDMEAARQAGPPESGLSVENTAPFGLSVLTATAEFAAMNKVAWIMDY